MSPRLNLPVALSGLMICCLIGCSEADRIEAYEVPKPHLVYEANHADSAHKPSPAAAAKPIKARMIAAMARQGTETWFFKLVGPFAAVSSQMDTFLDFVNTLQFPDAKSPPQWSVPAGWEQRPGSEMRFATLVVPSDEKPLEMSVIRLPTFGNDYDAYVLENVNRWRQQLGLAATTKDELYANKNRTEETRKIDVGGTQVVLVSLEGTSEEGGPARPPFAGALPDGGRVRDAAPSKPDDSSESAPVTYKVPDGWKRGKGTVFSVAAFEVEKDGQRVEITITPAAGSVLLNVQRWCQQVEMEPIGEPELAQISKKMVVDQVEGNYVELVGPQQTILGVILQKDGATWFVKLKGPSDLAQPEQPRFEEFVKSVKFR